MAYGRGQRPRGASASGPNLDELADELDRFQASAEEFRAETRVGGGTPTERRMADAFADQVQVYRALNSNVDTLREEVRELRRRIDAMDTMRSDFRELTSEAAGNYMADYGRELEALKARSERAIASIEGLDVSIGKKYEEAVDDAVKRLKGATALCIGLMLLAFACMFAATWVWTWGEESFMPWMHNLMAESGWAAIAFWVALTGVVLGGVAFVYSRTRKALDPYRR